jgi:Tol biopolymer transport system component
MPLDYQISQLTTTGNASRPAISFDGKFVAYVQQDGDDYSLWIRQTATPSNVQIVKAEPGQRIWGVTVSPDGGFVDFVRQGTGPRELWRVPFLGGTPRRILSGVDSIIAWSPDGSRFAFIRDDVATGANSLVVAKHDGPAERILASSSNPDRFASLSSVDRPPVSPAWSPAGDRLAVKSGQSIRIVALDGTEERTRSAGTRSGNRVA